jgi:ATP-dependent Lon protease
MPPLFPEYAGIVDYLSFLADLPWNATGPMKVELSSAREQLEADHYGVEKVKERVLEHLAVAKLKGGDMRGSILLLHGPPGIGKTSLGKSIADALDRNFHRVSLGGVHSESEIRGHRRTYVGAMPGLILQGVKKCGSNQCVMMLDEIDKLGRNALHGDPTAALLEVLDPEQNQNFRDQYLNIPYNLSSVLFIATANDLDPIPRPLRDRMEVIEMSGYTVEEKTEIARRHLLPKQLRLHGLAEGDIAVPPEIIDELISTYTREAGVRELDRLLAALCRSVAARKAEAEEQASPKLRRGAREIADPVHGPEVTTERLAAVLGPPRFDGPRDNAHRTSKPGVAAGLAMTAVGGDLLYVEAEQMPGHGNLMLTGQLGDVMQESAKAARSWLRAHAAELGIEGTLNTTDLHLHFPAGAIPKDGPSAGVTITTALVSLLTGRRVRPDLAMTGEVTLRGVVLPVGGVKEKVVAAHRAGMRTVVLPAKNEKDLRELPPNVLDAMEFRFVKEVDEVLAAALLPLDSDADAEDEHAPVLTLPGVPLDTMHGAP